MARARTTGATAARTATIATATTMMMAPAAAEAAAPGATAGGQAAGREEHPEQDQNLFPIAHKIILRRQARQARQSAALAFVRIELWRECEKATHPHVSLKIFFATH